MDITINPFEYENIRCPKCGGIVWAPGVLIKRIPGLKIGTGAEDKMLNFDIAYCVKCGEIFPEDRKLYRLDENEGNADTPANEPAKETPKSPLIIC